MAEDLSISTSTSKAGQYAALLPQIEALVSGEPDMIAKLANICAALKEQFKWFWVGFYMVKGEELVLSPFQGPVACTRIAKGKGVCGATWAQAKTIVVPDVDAFPGHIVCSSLSRSEIAVPLLNNNVVVGVLDVDSEHLDRFDDIDAKYLKQIVGLIQFNA